MAVYIDPKSELLFYTGLLTLVLSAAYLIRTYIFESKKTNTVIGEIEELSVEHKNLSRSMPARLNIHYTYTVEGIKYSGSKVFDYQWHGSFNSVHNAASVFRKIGNRKTVRIYFHERNPVVAYLFKSSVYTYIGWFGCVISTVLLIFRHYLLS